MTSTHKPLKLRGNREELIARAFEANDGCVSVGGLASKLGMLDEALPVTVAPEPAGLSVLGKFVQMARREQGLEPAAFAQRLGLDLKELLEIESARTSPELRVLYLVSKALGVSYEKLQILVGYRQVRDSSLERETMRFAASSGPMDKLSKSEAQALHDFVRGPSRLTGARKLANKSLASSKDRTRHRPACGRSS
jgi:transcriptional regulator with XRE-family HTH domain